MNPIPFLTRHWGTVLVGAAAVAAWGTMVHMRNTIDKLELSVEAAETREAEARNSLATERANTTELARRLELARVEAQIERRAREIAEDARDAALQSSEERGTALRETIVVERDRDPTLDQCLTLDLPDSIVRQLPFGAGAGGAGSDNR